MKTAEEIYYAIGAGYGFNGTKEQAAKIINDILFKANEQKLSDEDILKLIEKKDKIIHGQAQINSDYVKEIEELKKENKGFNELTRKLNSLLASKVLELSLKENEIERLKICEINLDISDKAYNQLNNEYQQLLSSKENEAVEFAKAGYEAGEKIIEHDWHMVEFHTSSCKCESLGYNCFDEWFNKFKQSKQIEK